MKEIKKLLNRIIEKALIIEGVLSNPKKRSEDSYNKIDLKPVLIRDEVHIQLAYHYSDKVIHENLELNGSIEKINQLLSEEFLQAMFFTKEADYQILVSKKGRTKILKRKATKQEVDLAHNKKKEYIIEDGKTCDFLIRLGVMNKNGKVVGRRYDKFRQINRFLEMVFDIIPNLDTNKRLNIIGLDLKHDVIQFCNTVARDLAYDKLNFIHGDIKDFEGSTDIDMVVTLHACDTATDAALVKAVNWESKVILSVPCCQHEFYNKIENSVLEPMLKHGIIKEKLSSLVTDSLRSNILEIMGYQVQMLEFIDMEHTPKNILIRAIRTDNVNKEKAIDSYIEFKKFWGLEDLYIENEFGNRLSNKIIKSS